MLRPLAITLCLYLLLSSWAWGAGSTFIRSKKGAHAHSNFAIENSAKEKPAFQSLHSFLSSTFNASLTRKNEVFAPEFTLSPESITEDEDFSGSRTIVITPTTTNPLVSYSLDPESVSFANLTFNSTTREITISAVENASGEAEIDVIAKELLGDSYTQTFTLTINPLNDPPTVENTIDDITRDENAEPVNIDISGVFDDVEDENLVLSVTSDNEALVQAAINGNNLNLTFSPDSFGKAIITLSAQDDEGQSISTAFTVKVNENEVAQPSFTISTQALELEEDFENTSVSITPDGSTPEATYTLNNSVDFANLSIDANTGAVTIQPIANAFGGPEQVSITATDLNDDENTFTASFNLEVTPLNDPPTVENTIDDITRDENAEPVNIDISGVFDDVEDENLVLSVTSDNEALVQAAINGNNLNLTFSPDSFGKAIITLSAQDDEGQSISTAFTVKVNENEVFAPEFTLSPESITEDEDFSGSRTIVITPTTTNPLVSYSLDPESVSFANLTFNSTTREITISAVENASGEAEIDVIAKELLGDSYTQTFTLTINPLNDPPTVENTIDDITRDENAEPVNIDISGVFDDVEDENLVLSVTSDNEALVQAAINGNNLNLTFSPDSFGKAIITLSAQDDEGQSISTAFTVKVNENEDQTPFFSLVQEIFEATEDFTEAVTVAVVPDDETVGADYSIAPPNIDFATLTADNSKGIYNFKSRTDLNGEQEFTITATARNNQELKHEEKFTFRVNAVNDQPVFSLTQNTINIETASGAQSFAKFIENIAPGPATAKDEQSQALAFTATAVDPSLFAVQPAINTEGTLTFTPADDNIGSTSVNVTLTDNTDQPENEQRSRSASFNIEVVEKPNAVPVADDAPASTNEDTPANITLTASDEDGDGLTFSIVAGPTHGSLGTLSGNQVTYTPDEGFSGSDSFTFRANDGTANSNTATISITVNDVNTAPVADDATASTNEDTPANITLTASDEDGDGLTFSIVAGPTHGSLGTLSGNQVTYTPDEGFSGSDSFTFRANDGTANSNTATISITVNDVNTAPVASTIPNVAVVEDAPDETITLADYFSDEEDDSLSYSIEDFSNEDLLTATIDEATSVLTLNFNENASGNTSITIRGTDSGDLFAETTFSVQVTGSNDAPTITGQNAVSVNEDQSYQILLADLIVEDADHTYPNGFTLSIEDGDNYEIIEGSTISPAENYNGALSVPVQVSDPEGAQSNTFNLSITVTPVNDAPVASTIEGLEVEEDALPVNIDLTPYFSDVDNETLTYSVASNSRIALVSTNIDGGNLQLTFTANSSGNATINIQASDGEAVSDPNLILTVTVSPTNDRPILVINQSISRDEDSRIDLTELLNAGNNVLSVTDPDNDFPADFFIEAQDQSNSNNYSLADNNTVVVPAENFDGNLDVPIRVNDGNLYSEYQTLRISLNEVNDRPVITLSAEERNQPIQFNRGDAAVNITSSLNITDVDNTNMASATISFVGDGQLFYSPDEDILQYPNPVNNIVGNWNASEGVLTLSGNANILDYVAAIRSVQYFNLNASPTSLPRQLHFTVNDGGLESNEDNDFRFIKVADSNLPPALTDFTKQLPEDESLTLVGSDFSSNYADDLDPFSNIIYITRLPDPLKGRLVVNNVTITDNDLDPAIGGFLINFNENPEFSYVPNADFNGTDSFGWTALDNETQPGTLINSASVNVTVLPVSDAPRITTPSSITASEDDTFNFSETGRIIIEDIDNDTDTLTINISVQEGMLNFTNEDVLSAIVFLEGDGTSALNMSFKGVAADLNNAFSSLQYTSSVDFSGTDVLAISATDPQNNIGTANVNIIVNAVNDLPTLTNIESDTLNYTENNEPIQLTNTLSIEDLENDNLVAATISITENFVTDEDRLGFNPTAGITGRVSGNRLILTGNASIDIYQTLLRSITYVNTGETPLASTRKINFQVTDVGNGSSNVLSRYVNVIQVDDSIRITGVETEVLAYRPGDGQQILSQSISLSDADDDSLTTAIVRFNEGSYLAQEDSLIFESEDFEVNWDEALGALIIAGGNTLEAYQEALRMVQYVNTSSAPTAGSRLISFTAYRNGTASNTAVRELTIIINEPPVLTDVNINLLKNSRYTFAPEDFSNHYNDPDNSSENLTFVGLRISELPVRGQLYLNDKVITQEILDTEGALVVSTEELSQLAYQPENNYVGKDSLAWNAYDGESYAVTNAQLIFNITDLEVNAGTDMEICQGDPVALNVSVTGGSGNYTFSWTCDQADCMLDNANAAEVSVSPNETTTYFVSVSDENGVTSNSDTITVNTIECYGLPLNIPTAFTPNGDGPNDSWVIANIETYENQVVEVYDRYGKQVFFSEGYQRPWDGARNGHLLPAGTYYYLIKLNNGEQYHRGSVSILK